MSAITLALALALPLAPLDVDPGAECRVRLARLESALVVYRRVHGGKLPANLSDLYTENFVERISDFACAESGALILKRGEIDEKCAFALDASSGRISEKTPHASAANADSKTGSKTTSKDATPSVPSPLVADEWELRLDPDDTRATISAGVLVLPLGPRDAAVDAFLRRETSGDFTLELDYATSAAPIAGKKLHVAGFGIRIRPATGGVSVALDCRTGDGGTEIVAVHAARGNTPLTAAVESGSGSFAIERRGDRFRFRHRVLGAADWTEMGELEAPLGSVVRIGLTTYKVGPGLVSTTVSRFRLAPSRD